MANFRTWLEAMEQARIQSVDEAKALSRSIGLDTAGIEFSLIANALEVRLPVAYDSAFSIVNLRNVPAGDKDKLLQMFGAFAQKMGEEPPDTLEQAQSLKIRGPDFRKMTPPIIVKKEENKLELLDGRSRVTAAKLLRVWELRAFVIG